MLKKFRAELTEITFMPWWRRLWGGTKFEFDPERKAFILAKPPIARWPSQNGPSTGGAAPCHAAFENEETWLRAVIICLRPTAGEGESIFSSADGTGSASSRVCAVEQTCTVGG